MLGYTSIVLQTSIYLMLGYTSIVLQTSTYFYEMASASLFADRAKQYGDDTELRASVVLLLVRRAKC